MCCVNAAVLDCELMLLRPGPLACRYVPPPMRPGAAGWAIDWGKAWVGYGAPRTGL